MYSLIKSKKPNKIFFAITNRCNMKCPFCFSRAGNEYHDLSKDIIQKIIFQLVEKKIFAVTITGGEPLMRSDFEELVDCFAPWQILSLNTNATLIDKYKAKYISQRFHSIMVSLDGPPDIHDSIRGKGSFEKAIQGIHYLMNEGKGSSGVFVNCTVTNQNKDVLDDVVKIALQCNIARINFGECLAAGRNLNGESDQLNVSDKINIAEMIKTLAQQYNGQIAVTTDYFNSYLTDFEPEVAAKVLSCGAGVTSAAILYTGQMVPCTLLGEEVASDGDFVQTSDLMTIWKTSENFLAWRKLREMTMQDICPSCEYNKTCMGGCRAEVYLQTGELYAKNRKYCLKKDLY